MKYQMADKDILRKNSNLECGVPVGMLHIKLKNAQPGRDFESVSFYCNQSSGHQGSCCFEGKDLVIFRKHP